MRREFERGGGLVVTHARKNMKIPSCSQIRELGSGHVGSKRAIKVSCRCLQLQFFTGRTLVETWHSCHLIGALVSRMNVDVDIMHSSSLSKRLAKTYVSCVNCVMFVMCVCVNVHLQFVCANEVAECKYIF